ncbi:class I lanthipeptide [Flavobacterium sp. LAR06]|uniref:class I lanthipeptide n=1 Tax=Flavobacterium sp. LAR06 TaxID=3064897 RepID=UPI0035C12201
MKKQNSNNKLIFNKVAVAELNDNQLQDVKGGSFLLTSIIVVVTIGAGILVSQAE